MNARAAAAGCPCLGCVAARMRANARLVVLRALCAAPRRQMRMAVLGDLLAEHGFRLDETLIGWLEDRDLVTRRSLTYSVVVCLLDSGHEVATGATRIEGVAERRPA